MHYTFSDTFFSGVEFSSVYRLGNLFCTVVPFRKITFVIDQVRFFFSIGSIFCSFKIFIIVPSTNSQGRKMQSHGRRSWLTSTNTCVLPFFAGWYTGSPNSVGFRYKPMYEKKQNTSFFFFFFFTKNRNIFACFQFFYAYYRKITLLTDWFHTP